MQIFPEPVYLRHVLASKVRGFKVTFLREEKKQNTNTYGDFLE